MSSLERLASLDRQLRANPGDDELKIRLTRLWRRLGKPGRNPLIEPFVGDILLLRESTYDFNDKVLTFKREVLDIETDTPYWSLEPRIYILVKQYFRGNKISNIRILISTYINHNQNDEAIVLRHGGKFF